MGWSKLKEISRTALLITLLEVSGEACSWASRSYEANAARKRTEGVFSEELERRSFTRYRIP